MKNTLNSKPLTDEELSRFEEAAEADPDILNTIIGIVLPHTGLRANTLIHMRRRWYREESEIRIIDVPEREDCVGRLKFKKTSWGLWVERRENRCKKCSKYGEFRVLRSNDRKVIVVNERAIELLDWWFEEYDSFPINNTSVTRALQTISDRAGIDRDLSPVDIRHTYAINLLRVGIEPEEVVRSLGYSGRWMLRPFYDYLDEEVPWDGDTEIVEKNVLELVKEYGPMMSREIAEALDRTRTGAREKCLRMREEGQLKAVKQHGHLHPRVESAGWLFYHPTWPPMTIHEELVELLKERGPATARELLDQYDCDIESIRRPLRDLDQAGVITGEQRANGKPGRNPVEWSIRIP